MPNNERRDKKSDGGELMRHSDIPKIPQHVRNFCEGELYKYLMNKALVEESKKEVALVLEEGGNRGFDKVVVQGGESVPEQQKMLEKIDRITRGREAMVAEKSCARIEGVILLLNDKERLVLEKYYWLRIPPDVIEGDWGIGARTQQRIRRRIIYLLAMRWGIM